MERLRKPCRRLPLHSLPQRSLCRDEHMPQGGSAASDIQTSAYLACVWGCFEATTLEWVPDSQKVQFRDDICTYARTDPLTKVGKDDHVWRSTPIPDKGQVSSGNEGRCTWGSVVGFSSVVAKERFTASFGASDVCDYGPHQRSTKNWHVIDQVQIPGSLPAGEYLLGWRWDAYMADQMWTGCADVQIVPFSTPSTSSSEADCPPAPPTTYPPPASPPPSPGGPLGGCTDNALPGNWGAAGRTCGTYEALGGSAYCAHQALAESCCFCGRTEAGRIPHHPCTLLPRLLSSARTRPSPETGAPPAAPAAPTRRTGARPTALTRPSQRAVASAAAGPYRGRGRGRALLRRAAGIVE